MTATKSKSTAGSRTLKHSFKDNAIVLTEKVGTVRQTIALSQKELYQIYQQYVVIPGLVVKYLQTSDQESLDSLTKTIQVQREAWSVDKTSFMDLPGWLTVRLPKCDLETANALVAYCLGGKVR